MLPTALAQSTLAIMQTSNGQALAMDLAISNGQPVVLINNQTFPVTNFNGSDCAIVNGQVVSIVVAEYLQTQSVDSQTNPDVVAVMTIKAGTGTKVVIT
jgi:hypothetical protein